MVNIRYKQVLPGSQKYLAIPEVVPYPYLAVTSKSTSPKYPPGILKYLPVHRRQSSILSWAALRYQIGSH